MLRLLQRIGIDRALAGHRGRHWFAISAMLWLLRKGNEVRRPKAEVVYRAVLEPGQTLVVDHTLLDRGGKPSKGRRRR